jgi:hypothetical protein
MAKYCISQCSFAITKHLRLCILQCKEVPLVQDSGGWRSKKTVLTSWHGPLAVYQYGRETKRKEPETGDRPACSSYNNHPLQELICVSLL